MQTTNQMLDRIKTDKQITSDYRLAQVLGVTKNAITNYRYGKSSPNDEVGLRMAYLLDEDPGHITACLHAERAQSPEIRQLWERIAMRLQTGFASVAILSMIAIFSLALTLISTPVSAKSSLPEYGGFHIMLTYAYSTSVPLIFSMRLTTAHQPV